LDVRRRTEQAAAVGRWLGLGGGRPIDGAIVVLSPHLDDAVFSLGAAIAAAPGPVTVVTVLGGDPDSELPAGPWDASAGFATFGESVRVRRAEDELACADLGATAVWLPFADHQYPRGADDEEIWARVVESLGDAAVVLVPGYPLMHDDHAWLEGLVRSRGLPGRRVGYYVEQPYAAAWQPRPADWRGLPASARDRLKKLRAARRYATQLPLLPGGRRGVLDVARYEAVRGGEAVRWS
jgi:LmbE family N-acetylglucosaminyl deacetylase